jgi:hypothetical protein
MKDEYEFKRSWYELDPLPKFSEGVIKSEPMLYAADLEFAKKNAGEITKLFIERCLSGHDDWIIDSRVHMLMPGWYPCIPGWHHDDVPRYTENGQPNYKNPDYKAEHIMCCWGDTAMPQFSLMNDYKLSYDKGSDATIYKQFDEQINRISESDPNHIVSIIPGAPVYFTWQDIHRGVPASKSGWRFFIRASRNTFRQKYNQIRINCNVYLSEVNAGW